MNNKSRTLRSIKGIGESRERVLNEALKVREPADLLMYTPAELRERLQAVKHNVSESEIDRWYREVRRLCKQQYEEFEQPCGRSASAGLPPALQDEEEGVWQPVLRFAVEYEAKTTNGHVQFRTIVRHTEHATEKQWSGTAPEGPMNWMATCLREAIGLVDETPEPEARAEEVEAHEVAAAESRPGNLDELTPGKQGGVALQSAGNDPEAIGVPSVEVKLVQVQHDARIQLTLSHGGVAGDIVLPDTPLALVITCAQDDDLDNARATFKRVGTNEYFEVEETAVLPGAELVLQVDALHAGTYSLVVRAGKRGARNATYIDVPMLLVA